MPRRLLAIAASFALLGFADAAEPKLAPDHAEKMAASAKLFKETVREFLRTQCLECHGGEKTKSGFSLATRETLLEGGDRGAAVKPNDAKASRLVKLLNRTEEPHMPPKGKVEAKSIEAIVAWIDLGANYDAPLVAAAPKKEKPPLVVTAKDKEYWAYRRLQKVALPKVANADWPANDVDRFVLAKMETAKLTPAKDASKATLLRRVTFDLTGLPPTVAELDAYLKDDSPNAFETVVDRLLASTAFGERWARHWLDPARYGESHGFEHDYDRPNAYHYRDFVVRALNADMRYDQFGAWQIAGDELAPNDHEAFAATGFLGAGVYPTQITNREAERIRYDAMDDMLSTTGHTFLATTVGCARCHDHKYDPIPTKDYYRLLSAFATTVRSDVEFDLSTPAQKKAHTDWEEKRKPLADAIAAHEKDGLAKGLATWIDDPADKTDAIASIAELKTAAGLKSLIEKKSKFTDLPKSQRDALLKWYAPLDPELKARAAKLAEWDKQKPALNKVTIQATTEGRKPMRHHTADGSIPDFYAKTYLLKRGDAEQKDGEVNLGVLSVLDRSSHGVWLVKKPKDATTSFRRASLANWIFDTEEGAGALAARVIVNRLWHHHFGRGLVPTLNDFGFQSTPPSHPELLEWLASDLVSNDWKLKRVHKMMVMSRTYRLGAAAEKPKADPTNLWLSYRAPQRLEGEAIRDNWLAVTGLLDRKMYGPGEANEGMTRRSLYFRVKRSQMIPSLQIFDWPDTLTSAAARPVTTVAPQALYFLNSPHVQAGVRYWAKSLSAEAAKNPGAAIASAYLTAFCREPSEDEAKLGTEFLKSGPLDATLPKYLHLLLGLNEFLYID